MKPLFSLLTLFIGLIGSQFTYADETHICLYGGNERIIKVTYTNPGSKVPCQVVYEKNTGSQVLWNAENEEGYCEAKAGEFVEKQRGWGWDCALMEATAAQTAQ